MNTETLLKYITNTQYLNKDTLDEIQKLVQLFPYSQNIQLLYLFNLSNIQDLRFGEQLQKTATYAANRMLLKKQIEELKRPVKSVPQKVDLREDSTAEIEPKVEEKVKTSDPNKKIEDRVVYNNEVDDDTAIPSSPSLAKLKNDKSIESQLSEDIISKRNKIRSKAELLQLVKNRLNEIEADKIEKLDEAGSDKIKGQDKDTIQNKFDIINKFIRNEPSISRPEKTAFFDPDVAAQESLFEDGAFVTETLAKIYYDQSNYRKALEIYQILSLNNPEKSTYFAALIQELENKLN